MEGSSKEFLVTVVAASAMIIMLAVFTILFLLLFVKKKRSLQRENELMQIAYEQTLLQTRVEIQEQTLKHISQEIHDNIGQVLSVVSLKLNTLTNFDPQKIADTDKLINKAIADLRGLSKSFNPDRIQQVGLLKAIENEFDQLEKTGRYHTRIDFDADVPTLSPEKTLILYRMFQEIVNNIIKHAKATEITVLFSEDASGHLITVSDNGQGFDQDTTPANGIGIQNINQRAKLIQGTARISSAPGAGTSVQISLKKEK
ncbi:sensor histidine kinase [Hufsiella ginkgonis]|uniref:histidine kinase n=1 Tax=Hufsiella ginkgonis TaxID=2695274 RepID=A0A7K1XUP0_9SPHI|nr:sensor histidine kinase [Hufsiella ginkgonis]MXV14206.1 hypothetical protein [Hufsiella ginkgonis]